MSVLNQVLTDLAARGAVADTGIGVETSPPLPSSLLAADPASTRRSVRPWIWSTTCVLALALAAGWWVAEQKVQSAATAPRPLGAGQFAPALAQNSASSAPVERQQPVAPTATTTTSASAPPAPGTAAATSVPATIVSSSVSAEAPRPTAAPPLAIAAAPTAPNAADRSARAVPAKSAEQSAPLPRAPIAASAPAARRIAAVAPGARTAATGTDDVTRKPTSDTAQTMARAAELIARGRNSEAVPLLEQTLAVEPAHAAARAALAALLAERGDRAGALAVTSAGLAHDAARFALPTAQLQAEAGDLDAALATLGRVPAGARDAGYYGLSGGVAQRAGRSQLAIDAYARALQAAPDRALWWIGYGLALDDAGRGGEAREAFARAAQAQLAPDVRRFVEARLAALASARVPATREVAALPAAAP